MRAPTSLPATRAEIDDVAARVLSGAALITAGLVILSALINEAVASATLYSRLRGGYGVVLLAAGVFGRWQQQRGHPRRASLGVLLAVVIAAWGHATVSGIGLHALVLTAALLGVALSGVLVSARAAVAFAGLNLLLMLAVYGAERAGALPGLTAAVRVTLDERLVGQLILTLAALMVALLLARIMGASLGRALDQEERLQELLRIGSDWTWEMNPKAVVTYLSPSFEQRTGRTVAEFLRTNLPGGPQVVDNEEWRLLHDDLRARRASRDRVITFRCVDGTMLTVRSNGDPVFDAGGRCIGWRGVGRNITAEREALKLQQRTQSMLDRLVQMSPDAICVARASDGRILLANPAFVQLAQRSLSEIIGKSAVELGIWAGDAEPQRLRDALTRDGIVRDLRSRVHDGVGAAREVLLTAASFEWDGEPVAVITTRDITDSERARLETEAILDNASVGIALVRDWRFERVNPVWETMFGRAVGSLGGQSVAELFPDRETFERFALQADQRLGSGQQIDIERLATLPSGAQMLGRYRASPIDAARALESGAIWVAEDITERRRAERELAEAKGQAEAANRAKSAFLATMSHEIRTPLNGVLGLARLLQDSALPTARRHEYLSHLVDAAELLSGIVSDVLDLSKIEAGHLEIETIVFDLHAVAHSTFRTFAPLGRERGLQMRCTVEAGVPLLVRGDPVRVRQIIANYLNNAVKFTVRGRVTLRLAPLAADRLRIEVHDTGVGVPEAARAALFTPFTQADSSTTRRFGGTGLGLSICRELAERMQGRVGVDSDGRSGSCFWAELMLPAEAAAEREAVRGPKPAQLPLAGLSVLIAEDNPVNMLIAAAMLRRLGAAVIEAEDGHQAVALAQEAAADLHAVLMDLHMPTLDGLEATRRLRADARTAALPVYALSAAVLEQERQHAEVAGMNGFIDKPVGEVDLLRVLQPLAEQATAARA